MRSPTVLPLVLLAAILALGVAAIPVSDNEIIVDGTRKIRSGEELVSVVVGECLMGDDAVSPCLKRKVLAFLDTATERDGRSVEDDEKHDEEEDMERLDQEVAARVAKFVRTHQFKLQLPEFIFQRATLTFRPSRSLTDFKVEFPKEPVEEDRALSKARGLLKKKLLLPLLLLLKLKMKLLMPIFVALNHIKAMKALILSKLSIALVLGFIIMQLCKKGGMPMMMPSMMPSMTVEPATPMPYGAPVEPSTPSTSYGTGWGDSGSSNGNGGPYSRVWDAHQVAYSNYYTNQQQPQSSQQSSSGTQS